MNNLRKIARQIGFYVVVLALWQSLALLKLWPPYVFPTPASVFEALRIGFSDHTFWIGIGVSLKRMLVGYTLSVILGGALGLLLAQIRIATLKATYGTELVGDLGQIQSVLQLARRATIDLLEVRPFFVTTPKMMASVFRSSDRPQESARDARRTHPHDPGGVRQTPGRFGPAAERRDDRGDQAGRRLPRRLV